MPEIPPEAVQALVPLQEAIRRVLIDARLGSDVDELSARVAVAVAVELGGRVAAAPILAAQERADERRKTAEQIAAALEAVDPVEWALAGQHAGQDAARIARQIGEAP